MSSPIVLDLETQHIFRDVAYNHKKLKVSVVGIYDYATNCFEAFFENELQTLFAKLEMASFIIGFNINKFDLPVLSPYYLGSIKQFETVDLLDEVEKSLGFRVALDDLARATLGVKKSGHGLTAIEYFKKGEFNKLKEYCLQDVRITKELYEYGKNNGKLFFLDARGKKEIPVNFSKGKRQSNKSISLSLPF